jgi:hypothetical protein
MSSVNDSIVDDMLNPLSKLFSQLPLWYRVLGVFPLVLAIVYVPIHFFFSAPLITTCTLLLLAVYTAWLVFASKNSGFFYAIRLTISASLTQIQEQVPGDVSPEIKAKFIQKIPDMLSGAVLVQTFVAAVAAGIISIAPTRELGVVSVRPTSNPTCVYIGTYSPYATYTDASSHQEFSFDVQPKSSKLKQGLVSKTSHTKP